MEEDRNAAEFRNINARLGTIEQILPTLATKDDLKAFATKDDLKGFPTQADPKGFATTADLKAESQETRRYMKVLYESLKADTQLLAEGLASMHQTLLNHDHLDIRADVNRLDLRVLKLEAKKKRASRAS